MLCCYNQSLLKVDKAVRINRQRAAASQGAENLYSSKRTVTLLKYYSVTITLLVKTPGSKKILLKRCSEYFLTALQKCR